MLNIEDKQGYKYTEEFGYIPEDWEVIALGQVGNVSMCKRIMKDETTATGEVPFYKIGTFGGEPDAYISKEKFETYKNKYSYPNKEDILISAAGTIGRAVIFDGKPAYFQDSNIVWLQHNNNKVLNKYLYYVYKTAPWYTTTGGTIARLYNENITKAVILKPSLKEQEKIAEVLGDVDSLIDKTQQLINKKKDLKTATMQKLLTPKEDWKTYKLGECSKICTGNENNENKIEDGLYPFFVRSENIERINTYSYDGEAILVPGEGGIGKIFHYINGKFNYHQRVYKISDFKYIDGKYTYYYMKKYFGKYALSNTVKATVDSLRLPTFEEFNIKCPTLAEQKIISQTITNMDSEMEALEKELNKYKDLKTGMMQQLLTGKIRLIDKEIKSDSKVVDITSAKPQNKANDEFKDAILISMLAYKFGSEEYPLGAFRRQKLSYLFKRHSNMPIDEYMKKAMGPYNPKMKYQGAEGIAIRNQYVKEVGGRGLVATDTISKVEDYYNRYFKPEVLDWLDKNFHYESNNNLEVLATVDYAIIDLKNQNKEITLENIKAYIEGDQEWKPKLKLDYFTDSAIQKAMVKSKTLLNSY